MIKLYTEGFGDLHIPTLSRLLKLTTDQLERLAGISSPRPLGIIHREGDPECMNYHGWRIIYLSATENYLGQLIYQFAHEYLHHLINGPMEGSLSGLKWFEETLCEVASRFVLWRFGYSDLCAKEGLCHVFPELRDYHDRYLPVDSSLRREFHLNGSVRPWLPLLGDLRYHRDHYRVLADAILPLFRTNPGLWRIVSCIGDSTQWLSLESLLSHFESEIPEVGESVTRLRRVLLGG